MYLRILIDWTEMKRTIKHVVILDSRDRDFDVYPTPNTYRLLLPRVFRNVVEARLVSAEIPSSFYIFSAAQGNTTMRVTVHKPAEADVTHDITIPDGNYTLVTMQSTLKSKLEEAFSEEWLVGIDRTTYKLSMSPVDEEATVSLDATAHSKDTETDWGLAYHLGFSKTLHQNQEMLMSDRVVSMNPQTYILLDIEELNGVHEGGLYDTRVGHGCFAKIPFPVNSFEYMYLDTSRCSHMPVKQSPGIPTLDRLRISWRFHDDSLVDFNNVEHSVTLELTCLEPDSPYVHTIQPAASMMTSSYPHQQTALPLQPMALLPQTMTMTPLPHESRSNSKYYWMTLALAGGVMGWYVYRVKAGN